MRAAAILGLGCSIKHLKPFQIDPRIEWHVGMPGSANAADIILLFGGDGTIHRHLAQLVKLGLPVLVVPTGSGNDFARALRLLRVRDAIAAWETFRDHRNNIRAVDLGVITALTPEGGVSAQHFFCTVACVGLDSEVARRANKLPRWLRGHGGYALTVVPAMLRYAPLPMKIFSPEKEGWTMSSDRPTILAAFANTSTYGGGMKIAPEARMDDGRLDVCVIRDIDRFKLFCMFPTVYFGRHLKIAGVHYSRALRLRVETEQPLDVYADGEYVCQTPVEISVRSAALNVLTP